MKKYTTSTDVYKDELAKNTLKVSLKEEQNLLMEVQAGNLDSKEHLFNKYLGFIVVIAEGLVGKESDILSDLIQEGNIILLKCINNYSLTLNTRFHGYVYINVLRGMQDYLLINKNYFNFPTKKLYLKDKIDKFINAYTTKYGINPSYDEIAEFFEMTNKDYKKINNLPLTQVDINDIKNRKISYADEIYDIEEEAIKKISYENFVKCLYRFSEISRDAQIVLMKYGVNCNKAYTSKEIGEIFDLTEARVNYIIKIKLQQYYKLLSTKDDIKSLVK